MQRPPELGLPALALEASVRGGSLALWTSESAGSTATLTVQRVLDSDQSHARDLIPVLDELLQEAGLDARQLATVVVGTGPGSFTGLRVAIATAQGLAHATGAGLIGVPSIAAMALGSLAEGETACILVDAFGGAAYLAVYRREAEGLETLRAPEVHPLEDLPDEVPAGERILALPGGGFLDKLPEALLDRVEEARPPRAGELLTLARSLQDGDSAPCPSSVEPLYLRPFAARPRRR